MQNVALAKGDVAIEPFFDATQEMLSGAALNFRILPISNTAIRVAAGTGEDQASTSVDGFYRYRTTNGDASHPGGAAGTYDIWITASANDFTGPPPTIDLTNYAFTPVIRAAGSPPTGVALMRKVGEVVWDGAKITRVHQYVTPGRRDGDTLYLEAPLAHMAPLTIRGAAAQTGALTEYRSSTDALLASINADGGATFTGPVTNSSVGGHTLSGAGGKTTLQLTNTGANTGITIGGDVALYRVAADLLRVDDTVQSWRALGTDDGLSVGVVADTFSRFIAKASGSLFWGPGNATQDTNLYRDVAGNLLRTDDALRVGLGLTVDAGSTLTGAVSMGSTLGIAATGKAALSFADTTTTTGLTIGADTNLYRSLADTLKTDDSLIVGSQLTVQGNLSHTGSNAGFFGVTSARAIATADIKDALTAYGLLQGTSASPLDLDGGALTTGPATHGATTVTSLTATGNVRLGDADADTLGFFSVAGAARAAATADIKDALASYGLLTNGGASPLDLDAGALSVGAATISGALSHTGTTAGFFGRAATAINATPFTNGAAVGTAQYDLPAGFTINQLAALVMTALKHLGDVNGVGLLNTTGV